MLYLVFGNDVLWTNSLTNQKLHKKYLGQGHAKSESLMWAFLALSHDFQRMSNLCKLILKYQAPLWIESILDVHVNCSVIMCSVVNITE